MKEYDTMERIVQTNITLEGKNLLCTLGSVMVRVVQVLETD